MNTLYDVLGISRNTNAAQIEQGYRSIMETLAGDGNNFEQDMIRAKAIKEAYAILSSPSRRQAYDEKLKLKEQVSYQVIEKPGFPWISIAVVMLLSAGAFGIYKHQAQKVELQRIALEAEKAKTAAEEAAKLAEAEESRLARELLREKERVDQERSRQTEQARREGQRIHHELQWAEAQAERQKDQAARVAKSERQQEERAALMRNQMQIVNMQRALAIPIVRH
jgi:DnaJ-class molecular chaperone